MTKNGDRPGRKSPAETFSMTSARHWSDASLSGHDLRVLMVISSYDRNSARRGGEGCWASLATLADDMGSTVSQVSRSISKLCDRGHLMVQPHPRDRRRKAYQVNHKPSERDPIVDKPANEILPKSVNETGEIVDNRIGIFGSFVGRSERQENQYEIKPFKRGVCTSSKDGEPDFDLAAHDADWLQKAVEFLDNGRCERWQDFAAIKEGCQRIMEHGGPLSAKARTVLSEAEADIEEFRSRTPSSRVRAGDRYGYG